ncbi:hypothetical protein A2803_01195 [Candidatus Woesebacteria bacterium RIFCSPHIGHO2_01_FULL_44_21]|uniref:DUF2283 domain-containing protein n=1 Tax=Candidatus Woesebacteria bacterium RIFCSPHIGHO2_01_FULL_44_21 TaxID=1802503 RepID=A0A1F7Z128_9BACT|nr:MAG: hypothetical protein A2803_01195 [Candidatus Woesebacteria bacterium RIFCSPHIGHO2_01_FULL_44_21]OGM70808.1 MAG: hypothetical protein A2897_05185 [Candidatus Woesebacteria bacterium RIFCSPLOWO2_01_FULL_44_24b]
MEQTFVTSILPKLGLHHIMKMQRPPLWLTYDREGDALHVIFEEAKKSDKSALDKNDIIFTKRGEKVINMTVLNASRFIQ